MTEIEGPTTGPPLGAVDTHVFVLVGCLAPASARQIVGLCAGLSWGSTWDALLRLRRRGLIEPSRSVGSLSGVYELTGIGEDLFREGSL